MQEQNKTSRTVLEMPYDEARAYFLKQESYCTFDLPPYFKFEALLSFIDKKIDGKNLSDYKESKESTPRHLDGVNYTVLDNKDGKYAWRPLQLINPAIYVSLVHKITTEENWQLIQNRFGKFAKNENIECTSMPRESLEEDSNKTKKSDKAAQISNWLGQAEQRSIELALEYSCLTHTDLTNCYGSIYTHSVAWAMHGKKFAKQPSNRNNLHLVGCQIDNHLQDMSYGQTNGIPQGSTLMDFFAEMVLGYADRQLSVCLKKQKVENYKILRYRDDYRIFSNSQNDNDKIIKCLTEVMIGLGLRINAQKTNTSKDLITGSIKKEKLFWLKQKQTDKDSQKRLLIIHDLAMQFPNSGSLMQPLFDFGQTLRNLSKNRRKKENIVALISIATDIAHNNPKTYPQIAAIISLLLRHENNPEKKIELLGKVIKKFDDIPNTGHLDIWIQRIEIGISNKFPLKDKVGFEQPLCKYVRGENISIWNFSWLKDKFRNELNDFQVFDAKEAQELSESISKKEIELFKNRYYGY